MCRLPRLLIELILVAATVSAAHSEAPPSEPGPVDVYIKTMEQAQSVYRKGLADSLREATKIEIYLLDFEVKRFEGSTEGAWKYDLPKDQFPIGPYKSVTRILKRKVLTAAEIKQLMPPLQSTIGVEKNNRGAMCHFPIHGIRVWAGERLVLETSFCWLCGNFALEYPDFTDRWVGIQGTKLKEIVNDLMPIPQAELDRFRKAYPDDLRGK